jgi:hypothetical protein
MLEQKKECIDKDPQDELFDFSNTELAAVGNAWQHPGRLAGQQAP